MKKYLSKSKLIFALIVLSTIMFFLHFLTSNYPKLISVYPDELRYTSIAQSLLRERSIKVYNEPTDFQKILYSILISPAYFSNDVFTQEKIISALNCAYLSLGIVPTYLLAKKLIKNSTLTLTICFLYFVSSDWTFSCSFMSENVFLPMGLFGVYFSLCMIEKFRMRIREHSGKKELRLFIVQNILLGFYFWMMYLCKEIALVFPISYMIFIVFIIAKGLNKNHSFTTATWPKSFLSKTTAIKKSIITIVFLMIGFTIPFMISKVTFFKGLGESYHQQSIDALTSNLFNLYFAVYGCVYFVLMTSLAYYLPVMIFSFFGRKRMSTEGRDLYHLLILLLVISAATISYTITIREDWGVTLPRLHLRYTCYLFLPFVITALHAISNEPNWHKSKKKLLLASGCIIAWYYYYFLFDDHLIMSNKVVVDNTMTRFLTVNETPTWQLFIISIYAVAVFITVGLIIKNKTIGVHFFLLSLIVLNLVNSTLMITLFRGTNEMSNNEQKQVSFLQEFDEEHPDSTILLIELKEMNPLIDTSMQRDNVYEARMEDLYNVVKAFPNQQIAWENVGQYLHALRLAVPLTDLKKVDYILLSSENEIEFTDGVEQITNPTGGIYIYKVEDNQHIPEMHFHLRFLSLDSPIINSR